MKLIIGKFEFYVKLCYNKIVTFCCTFRNNNFGGANLRVIQGGFKMNKKEYIKRKARNRKYINSELCSTCPYSCCKYSGCDALPFDIEPFTRENVIRLIDKGIYSITYTFTYDRRVIPVLRSREVDAGVFNLSNQHKPCALLGENGCILTEEQRPTLALLLIPKLHPFHDEWRNCKSLVRTREFIKMWDKVSDIMEDVVEHYTDGKDFETLFREYQNERN